MPANATYLRAIEGGVSDEPEVEIPAKRTYPLIPDATYTAECTGCDVSTAFGVVKLFYHFRVLDGAHAGTSLFRPYHAGNKIIHGKGPGTGPRPQLAPDGDLATMLRRVFDLDNKRQKFALRALVGKVCRITTRTITKDRKRQEREPYSVVDEVLSIKQ